jgi:rhodanese-related sulfurtransferase
MDTVHPDPVPHPPPLAPSDLYHRLGGPGYPLVVDVRMPAAFDGDAQMLPGSIRVAPEAIDGWDPTHARSIVTVCVHGHEVSQRAADALRRRGYHATHLEGGIELWRELGLSLLRKAPGFGVPGEAPSRWVTRERPKIDRIACPWLVRRFIDPLAQFDYVPAGEVLATAARTGAVAYDAPGAPLGHRGELCSFDAFIAAFELSDPALLDLASIVRGADTGRLQLTPQSAGLYAISLGLSRNFPDDPVLLEQGLVVYDALYAWCRHARDEAPAGRPPTAESA